MTTAAQTRPIGPSANPLRPRPDQAQRWLAHAHPLSFSEAAAIVLDAHRHDGERKDEVTFDLRTWAFGSADQESMQVARIPLRGREPSKALVLRDLAFAQLCQRVGTPAPYIRDLPFKLQVACMNWGLSQTKQNALLRLANDEVRAIVSERYAAIDDNLLLEVVDE